jgi:hypothetical protein
MGTLRTETDKKKIYEKPSIRIISIADSVQVLGIGCKTMVNTMTGPYANPCVPGIRCNQPAS